MKVGFHVGQVVFRGADLQQQWQDQLEQFRLARDVGFDFVSWGHHWLVDPFQHFQPIPVLSRFAAEAGDMDLVTGVLLIPLLNPVQVAEDIATLDHICEGKLVFGVGLGYRSEEFEAAGFSMSQRAPLFEEGLGLMKRLWTEDEVTHHGRFYNVTNARPTAKPYQRPHPRIWIAGMADAPIRRAGRLGHSYFALGMETLQSVKRHLDLWRETLTEHGHVQPTEVPIMRELFVAESHEEAYERARSSVEAKYRGYAEHGLPMANEAMANGIDDLMNDPFVIGTPDECIEKLAPYADIGVTHVALRVFWPTMSQADALKMTELVGSKIIPALRTLG